MNSIARLALVVSACLLVSGSSPTRAQNSIEQREKPPIRPWIPPQGLGSRAASACGNNVLRDGHRSIQANVDRRGCNIAADAANEPSIAFNPEDPREIVIGWRQFNSVASDYREPGWTYSRDGGHTWVFRGSLDPGVFGSDPVLAAARNGRIHYLSINFEETRLFTSGDGGLTWPTRTQVVPYFCDKPWMTVDQTGGLGDGNLYVCSSCNFRRSVDLGTTFQIAPVSGGCWGGTVAVDNAGVVFTVSNVSLRDWPIIERSSDARIPSLLPSFDLWVELTIGPFTACSPSGGSPNGGLLGQTWVATGSAQDPDPSPVYLLLLARTDPVCSPEVDPSDVIFTRSDDGGWHWTRPRVINDDPMAPRAWQWFNTMSVAPNGRIDVIWNDTRASLVPNLSEVYYSYSTDRGETWSKNVPISPQFDSWIGYPVNQHKLGDYYHMVSDNLGANLAYAATFNGEQDVYFLRIGPWDCNGNEIDDALDISAARTRDCNHNEVPDECEYRVDLDGDGLTTPSDFAAFRAALTGPNGTLPGVCPELLDPDHDADADLHDFHHLLEVYTAQ